MPDWIGSIKCCSSFLKGEHFTVWFAIQDPITSLWIRSRQDLTSAFSLSLSCFTPSIKRYFLRTFPNKSCALELLLQALHLGNKAKTFFCLSYVSLKPHHQVPWCLAKNKCMHEWMEEGSSEVKCLAKITHILSSQVLTLIWTWTWSLETKLWHSSAWMNEWQKEFMPKQRLSLERTILGSYGWPTNTNDSKFWKL